MVMELGPLAFVHTDEWLMTKNALMFASESFLSTMDENTAICFLFLLLLLGWKLDSLLRVLTYSSMAICRQMANEWGMAEHT